MCKLDPEVSIDCDSSLASYRLFSLSHLPFPPLPFTILSFICEGESQTWYGDYPDQ